MANIIEKHEGYIVGKIELVKKSERYIWRTQKDDKVRDLHRVREGKIFYWYQPPQGGHPGQAPGCRCVAQEYHMKDKTPENVSKEEIKQIMQSKEYQYDKNVQNLVEGYFKYHYN